jgi:phosphoserine aminotransferase
MIAVADCLDALNWAESIGGLKGTMERSKANFETLNNWVDNTPWVELLPGSEEYASYTSVCLKIVDDAFTSLGDEEQTAFAKAMVKLLDKEGIAFDFASYRDAPAGLRIWAGATIEKSDLEILTRWLDWAFETVKAEKA